METFKQIDVDINGKLTGLPFVKDHFQSISIEALVDELLAKRKFEAEEEERVKEEAAKKKIVELSPEEQFNKFLYGELNLQSLASSIFELLEPEVERKVEDGVANSSQIQQLMEFYEDELN